MGVLRKSDGAVVATEVEFADTWLKQAVGLMFRKSIPSDYAMIFDLRREQYISIHMLFVFFPIDIIFLDKERKIIDTKKRVKAFTGLAWSKEPSQYVIELPVGTIERFRLNKEVMMEW